ncbi:hypothetical protein [Mesorhizobium sp. B2-6-1]|uniref:hypothetical protein n=1 Tax=Mesorhizobium sp. B2-6-1 TaxID=2589916 RepID=UPI00112C4D1A|nr:hypothetical protein [Mesorhizobium sp. B2-6-1]TPJ58655.1 hypothetical protein FJ443_25425 [Mesorhizobium sp. B2-6-1]
MNVEVADEIEKLASLRERGIISKRGHDYARSLLTSGKSIKISEEIEKLYVLLCNKTVDQKEFEKTVSSLIYAGKMEERNGKTRTAADKHNNAYRASKGSKYLRDLTIIALIAAFGFGFPIFAENSSSACDAAEKRAISIMAEKGTDTGTVAFSNLAGSLSSGRIFETVVRSKYPNIPPALSCAYAYWNLLLNPDEFLRHLTR